MIHFVNAQCARHMREQAQQLIQLMKSDSRVNYENDWKLVTIFIGGNDLCPSCRVNYKHHGHGPNLHRKVHVTTATVLTTLNDDNDSKKDNNDLKIYRILSLRTFVAFTMSDNRLLLRLLLLLKFMFNTLIGASLKIEQ